MIIFWYSILVLVFWAAILTLIAVWSRKDIKGRGIIVALFCLSIPIISIILGNTFGNHRPISWEQIRKQGSLTTILLGHKIIYEKGIYIYIDRPGAPLALVLPWNTETAEQLQDAIRDAGPTGDVVVEIPYEQSLDNNPPQFHPLPQPKFLPDKPIPDEPQPYERGA